MKILIAADGSKYTKQAINYLITHRDQFGAQPEIRLINVHHPLPGRAAAALGKSVIAKFYAEEAQKATAEARKILDKAGLKYSASNLVGDAGVLIAAQASKGGFDLVVMGSHGHSSLSNLVLGSVATKVLSLCKVPVLVIR